MDDRGKALWVLSAARVAMGFQFVWTRWLTDRPAVARTDPSRS